MKIFNNILVFFFKKRYFNISTQYIYSLIRNWKKRDERSVFLFYKSKEKTNRFSFLVLLCRMVVVVQVLPFSFAVKQSYQRSSTTCKWPCFGNELHQHTHHHPCWCSFLSLESGPLVENDHSFIAANERYPSRNLVAIVMDRRRLYSHLVHRL